MKRWFEALTMSLAALSACGDASDAGGGPAGGSGGVGALGGSGGSGASGADGGSGGTGAASVECTSLSTGEVHFLFTAVYDLEAGDFGGAVDDVVRLELFPAEGQPLGGVQNLGANGNDNYGTCTTCFVAGEDLVDGIPTRFYFAESGTIDLGAVAIDGVVGVPITAGFVDAARLVEVTVDPETFTTTKVDGGACLLVSGPIAMTPPPEAWTCDPSDFEDKHTCDCDCGVVDPDCLNPDLPPPPC